LSSFAENDWHKYYLCQTTKEGEDKQFPTHYTSNNRNDGTQSFQPMYLIPKNKMQLSIALDSVLVE
jgi:hypothetical protein